MSLQRSIRGWDVSPVFLPHCSFLRSFFSLLSLAPQGSKPAYRKLTEISYVRFICPLSRGYTLSCRISEFAHLLSIRWGHCSIYAGGIGSMAYFLRVERKDIGIWGMFSSLNQLPSSSPFNSMLNSRSCWECEAPIFLFTKFYHSVYTLPHRAFLKTNEIMSSVQCKPVPSQLNERCYVLWPSLLFSWT